MQGIRFRLSEFRIRGRMPYPLVWAPSCLLFLHHWKGSNSQMRVQVLPSGSRDSYYRLAGFRVWGVGMKV